MLNKNINDLPILNYDPSLKSVLEPSELIEQQDVPKCTVVCFFSDVISKLVKDYNAKKIFTSRSEMGEHPIYEIQHKNQRLAFFHPGVGAPLAVGLMEEAIALGVKYFVACGGCGVLDKNISVGHFLLPTSAYRDEGTSYHYLPPAASVDVNPQVLGILEMILRKNEVAYLKTKSWTTDAIYRETVKKIDHFLHQGCLTVEMELAAFLALAQFRKVYFGQYLYSGDVVSLDGWDGRKWTTREVARWNLFWISADACLEMQRQLI